MRVQVLVLAVLIFGVACDGEPEPVPADPVRDQPIARELPCDQAIDAIAEVPRSYETILDVVALPTARSSRRALQAFEDDSSSPPVYFAKTGLLVRAGEAFTVEVTQPGTNAIGWGAPPASGHVSPRRVATGTAGLCSPVASRSRNRPASS